MLAVCVMKSIICDRFDRVADMQTVVYPKGQPQAMP